MNTLLHLIEYKFGGFIDKKDYHLYIYTWHVHDFVAIY